MSFVNFDQPPAVTLPNPDFFDALYAKGQDFINLGASSVTNIENSITSFDLTQTEYSYTPQNPNSLNLPDVPNAPDVQDLSGLTAAVKPVTPVLDLKVLATDPVITDLITKLKLNFETLLATPITLDTAVESAIYSRAVDRETAAAATGYANYLANNASVGWETATGQDIAAYAFFETERKGNISEINRDIAIKRSDVQLSILIKQAELDQANAQYCLTGLQRLEENLTSLRVSEESNKLRIFESEIDIFKSIYQIFQANYAADIQRFQAEGSITEAQSSVLMKQLESINQYNLNLVNLALQKAKMTADFEISKHGVLVESLKTTGTVLVQAGAAYLNSINYSQSWSQGLSYTAGESYST